MSKEKAFRIASKRNRDVHFISLAASDTVGMPREWQHILDIATSLEMTGKNVNVVNVLDLQKRYELLNPTEDVTKVNVYDLVVSFVKQNKNCDVFVDECPIIATFSRFGICLYVQLIFNCLLKISYHVKYLTS